MNKSVEIKCIVCGDSHWVTPANKNTKCCSRGCANTFRASKIPRPKCSHCNTTVVRRLSHCYRNGGKDVFCNKQCEANFRKNRIILVCDVCHREFERIKSQARKNKHTFCNKKCETIGMHDFRKTIGRRYRSYGECAIVHLLRKNFPHLIIEENDRRELYGYEIDIWIPSLRIGIEYNGPHHFKPVYGEKIFRKTQHSDKRKRLIAKGKNIKMVDINVIKSLSYTHKSMVKDLFVKVCKKIGITPTTFEFDPQTVLTERNKSPIIGTFST